MNLTPAEKIKIIIIVICYLFLFGFLKIAILRKKIDVRDLLINSILLFIWLGLSQAIANTFD